MDARLAGSAPPPRQPEQLLFRELSNSYSIYVPAPCCALALSVRSLHQLLRLTETVQAREEGSSGQMRTQWITNPLCPGDSKMGRPLREARANILDAGVMAAFRYCGKHHGQKQLVEERVYHNHSPSRREAKIGN